MENNKHTEPLVSVIIPSYNHEKYIRQSIERVITQTYKNIELIVVDDGSTDDSKKIITDLNKKYHFKKIFQENRGLAATLTETIKSHCNGKYISICASDDYWREDKIELQVKFMDKNPEYAMCYSKCYYVDKDSNILKSKKINKNEKKFKGGNIFEDLFLIRFHPPVSYLFKKIALEEIGYYPNNVYCEDFYMNLKIAQKYKIGFINDYLMYYRHQTNSPQKTLKIINSQLKILLEFKNEKKIKKAIREWKLRSLSTLSYYPELKNESKNFLLRLHLINDIRYWKSVIKLLIK